MKERRELLANLLFLTWVCLTNCVERERLLPVKLLEIIVAEDSVTFLWNDISAPTLTVPIPFVGSADVWIAHTHRTCKPGEETHPNTDCLSTVQEHLSTTDQVLTTTLTITGLSTGVWYSICFKGQHQHEGVWALDQPLAQCNILKVGEDERIPMTQNVTYSPYTPLRTPGYFRQQVGGKTVVVSYTSDSENFALEKLDFSMTLAADMVEIEGTTTDAAINSTLSNHSVTYSELQLNTKYAFCVKANYRFPTKGYDMFQGLYDSFSPENVGYCEAYIWTQSSVMSWEESDGTTTAADTQDNSSSCLAINVLCQGILIFAMAFRGFTLIV